MAINPITGLSDTELVPTINFRWFAHRPQDHKPTLQQAWTPRSGGRIEWRDVPIVYGTDGLMACAGCQPRPLCRDCADNDGTCPNDGLPCDPKARHTCGKYAAPGAAAPDGQTVAGDTPL